MENPRSISHQCEGTFSSSAYHKKLCISKGKSFDIRRQQCGFFIPKKGWRKENDFKSTNARPLVLVHDTQHSSGDHLGKISRMSGRLIKSNTTGFGGLYPKPSTFSIHSFSIPRAHKTRLGHVCLPGQSPTSKICLPVAPLASFSSRCPELPPRPSPLLLCQPPLDPNRQVAPKTLGAPPYYLFNDNSILGFSTVVAPFTKVKSAQNTGSASTSLPRLFHKLPGDPNAPNPVAPNLHNVIRGMLEKQQMSAEGISLYLEKLPSLVRYQNAFNHFWSLCVQNKVDFQTSSLWTIAGELLKLHKQLPHQARNAYSALLLIPGFDQLRFSPILRPCKREWNISTPKYSTFYSATPFLQKLDNTSLRWSNLEDVRNRLIICWRFIQLARSIDLSRLYRTISLIENRPFVWIHRKGWQAPRWEEIICLPDHPNICPWTLLKRYVSMTATLPKDSLVLRALIAPFQPLSSNTIASLTRKVLHTLGLNTQIWSPHSTRGAGVTMYKAIGLNSEEVCELGKWKNTSAFTSHYLRLGAPLVASQKISSIVHSVSSRQSVEPDWSRTPGTGDRGGSDQEGGAQSLDEPNPPTRKRPHTPDTPPRKFQFALQRRQPPSSKQ